MKRLRVDADIDTTQYDAEIKCRCAQDLVIFSDAVVNSPYVCDFLSVMAWYQTCKATQKHFIHGLTFKQKCEFIEAKRSYARDNYDNSLLHADHLNYARLVRWSRVMALTEKIASKLDTTKLPTPFKWTDDSPEGDDPLNSYCVTLGLLTEFHPPGYCGDYTWWVMGRVRCEIERRCGWRVHLYNDAKRSVYHTPPILNKTLCDKESLYVIIDII
jgi:hypothetical protein